MSTMRELSTCPIHSEQSPPPKPFRLLDLPPEIRNQIAALVLTSDEPIRIRQPRFNRHPEPSPEPFFTLHPRLDFPLPRTPPPTPPGEEEEDIDKLCSSSRSKDGCSRLALLMACRQLYAENWATYYACNTFSFTSNTWPAFNSAVPSRCLYQLRHMRVRMPYRSRHVQMWRSLGELENLATVDVILAPPGHATRLERMNCIQGVRFCENLRKIKIEREGIGEGIGPVADDREKQEIAEDRRVERSINRDLSTRWRRKCKKAANCPLLPDSTEDEASPDNDSRNPPIHRKSRTRRADVMPDERSMDAYFSVVTSEESEADEHDT